MNKVFENELFTVEADTPANIYRVINKQSGILEETTPSMYEAMWYAVNQHAMIEDVENRARSSWPSAPAKKQKAN